VTAARGVRIAAWIGLLIVVLALPSVLSDQWLAVAVQGLLLCFGTLGLTLLAGYGGQFSIASAGLMAVGAAGQAICTLQIGAPAVVGLVGAMLFGGAVGLLIGLPALRVKGLYLMLATLAAHFIALYFWRRYVNDNYGAIGVIYDPLNVLGFDIATDRDWYFLLVPLVALVMLFVANVKHTGVGRSLFAIKQNEVAAAASGINVPHLKLAAFVVSSALTALGGALYAQYYLSLTSEYFTLQLAINFFVALIVGGQFFAGGAVVGAMFVVAAPVFLTNLSNSVGNDWLTAHTGEVTNFIFGAAIIAVLMTQPGGIWGGVDWVQRRLRWRSAT
jgi:branched-chain amino acid transport system permease protein